MTDIYGTFFAPIATMVEIRRLSTEDSIEFYLQNEPLDADDFRVKVLMKCVVDFSADIMPILGSLEVDERSRALESLYRACISLNPGLNWVEWTELLEGDTSALGGDTGVFRGNLKPGADDDAFGGIDLSEVENELKGKVVGQEEAIEKIVSVLKRGQAGLIDEGRPVGVFLFAGVSGVGKTLLAKEIHESLYGGEHGIVRIDGGEYQHKHENQKLLGSPPGYSGYEEGGQLTEPMLKNPHRVILIDEVEKAHVDILNTFLKVFDEGALTDSRGNEVSFENAIIIMTTNLGSADVISSREGVLGFSGSGGGGDKSTLKESTMRSVRNHFTPELLNRVDSVVVFNPLDEEDHTKIAELELTKLGDKLSKKGFRLVWSEDVPGHMASMVTSIRYGARGAERFRRKELEVELASLLLSKKHRRGTTFQVVVTDGELGIYTQKRVTKKQAYK